MEIMDEKYVELWNDMENAEEKAPIWGVDVDLSLSYIYIYNYHNCAMGIFLMG